MARSPIASMALHRGSTITGAGLFVASAATGRLVVSRRFSCCFFLCFFPRCGGGWGAGLGGGDNMHTRSLRRMRINLCISASCRFFYRVEHTRSLRRIRINSCISASCQPLFVVLSKRESSAMYEPLTGSIVCLACVPFFH